MESNYTIVTFKHLDKDYWDAMICLLFDIGCEVRTLPNNKFEISYKTDMQSDILSMLYDYSLIAD